VRAPDRSIVVSVDVEPDVALFVDGKFGLTEGLGNLTDLFRRLEVPVDYYFTLDAAREVPDFAHEQARDRRWVGCHGLFHHPAYYSRRSPRWQKQAVVEATAGLKEIVRKNPEMFRTPNFSVSEYILQSLESLEYYADSSVLPGRHKKIYRILKATDHRTAPHVPYHPSFSDPCSQGGMKLWEFPITENPAAPGAPIGLGFVNSSSVEVALQAVRVSVGPVVTVLCHPWEAIDLRKRYSGLPEWLTSTCRSDLRSFERFLSEMGKELNFTCLRDLVHDYVSLSKPVNAEVGIS